MTPLLDVSAIPSGAELRPEAVGEPATGRTTATTEDLGPGPAMDRPAVIYLPLKGCAPIGATGMCAPILGSGVSSRGLGFQKGSKKQTLPIKAMTLI